MIAVYAATATFIAGGFAGAAAFWLAKSSGAFATFGAAKTPLDLAEPTVPPELVDDLAGKVRAAYEAEIQKASRLLADDLSITSKTLMEQVSRLTTQVIETELEGYQRTLEEMRMAAAQTMEDIHQTVEDQRQELRAQMQSEVKAERERLAAQFDTRLGDIVASYVAESLGGGVDLGSQMQYITESLEERRDEMKKDLLNGI